MRLGFATNRDVALDRQSKRHISAVLRDSREPVAHKPTPSAQGRRSRAMAEMLYRKRGQRYVPDPELSALAPFDAVEMLICTTRYYTGRSTISASIWADDLARHWASLPKGARTVIKRDLENAFRRDNALGDDVPARPHIPVI